MGMHKSVAEFAATLTLQRWWLHENEVTAQASLRVAAAQIACALMEYDAQRIALYCDGFDDFVAALVGCLLARKTVVLLPSLQPQFVASVRTGFDLLISDRSDASDALAVSALPKTNTCRQFDGSSLAQGRLEIFTSGSTGEPKRIDKSLAQLEAEINALQLQWGDVVGAATTVCTVSHQHIYGLLFRVLWPLLAGRDVVGEQFQYPESLLQKIQSLPACVLVTSPAQLKRMPDLVDMTVLADGRLRAIFSSGGRLDNRTALAVQRATGIAVTEVLGSTETGGVAWRQQLSVFDRALWWPLPGVTVSVNADEALLVRSPFIGNAAGNDSGISDAFVMGDRARLDANGSFDLLDRLDSIVKVEGKRVALTEVAARLMASPLVDDAAAVLLQAQRDSIAVVVVLSAQGRTLLAEGGRRVLNETLRAWLAGYFEAVVLPKKWRYVAALPLNAQGKTVQRELQALFQEQPRPVLPRLVAAQQNADEVSLQLLIPPDLFYFQGHFAERPILPGVVQISWALHFGRQYLFGDLQCKPQFKALEAIKFQSFVVPAQQIELQLRWAAEKHKLTFTFQSTQGMHSSGRIVMSPPDAGGVPI